MFDHGTTFEAAAANGATLVPVTSINLVVAGIVVDHRSAVTVVECPSTWVIETITNRFHTIFMYCRQRGPPYTRNPVSTCHPVALHY